MIRYDEFIHFGQAKHGAEFQQLNLFIKKVAYVASIISYQGFSEQLVTHSIYRKKTNDSGAHEAYIAIDFAPLSTIEKTYALIDIINHMYTYDPSRPTMKVAEPPYHGTGAHIHLQAREFTTTMPPDKIAKFNLIAQEDKAKFKPMALEKA